MTENPTSTYDEEKEMVHMTSITTKEYQADVAIIGGGLSGLSAAIEASRQGAEVLVVEKGNTLRSGLAGSGIDHIQAHIPEFHDRIGYTTEDLVNDQYEFGGNIGGLRSNTLARYFAEHSGEDIRELERYGIQFRFENPCGQSIGHLKPCGYKIVPQFHYVPTSYNFAGRDIKRVLTKEVLKVGVRILNRVQVRSILVDEQGAAAGVVGMGTRSFEIVTVQAKTTILATQGGIARISKAGAGGTSFENFAAPSASTGAGKVLAAHVGARVLNMELTGLIDTYALMDYSFSVGLPSGSWWPAGRIVDENGEVVVPRNTDIPEETPQYKQRYRQLVEDYYSGRGRIAELLAQGRRLYFDLQEASEEELENIWWALGHEGKTNVLKHHLIKQGVDFKEARFPLRLGGKGALVPAGIWVKDDTTETDVLNLYATGDEIAGTGSGLPVAGGAIVFGKRSGEQAALRAREIPSPTATNTAQVVEGLMRQTEALLDDKNGSVTWKQAEESLQNLAEHTLGRPYTQVSIEDDLSLLSQATSSMRLQAGNPHELSRCFEVSDLYQILGFIYHAILARTSSLGPYIRADEADYVALPWGVATTISIKDGKPSTGTVSFHEASSSKYPTIHR
ncbi:MAG: FAD-dependent oxidoreductase [Coriobacteriaceae bacterium]|nr:FAD-dependent oxidoreductase [Coriobacteriaceae bacterium]